MECELSENQLLMVISFHVIQFMLRNGSPPLIGESCRVPSMQPVKGLSQWIKSGIGAWSLPDRFHLQTR